MEAIFHKEKQQQSLYQTQFFYGKNVQKTVGALLKPHATKILVLSGMELLQRTSWYKQLRVSLQAEQISFIELGGITENTELTQIEKGIALCQDEHVDYILAVGGGSVIDSAKAIAMGAVCDHCVWMYFNAEQAPKAALPLSVLLTIPGSGSENNGQTMIQNDDTLLKLCCRSTVLQPQYCFINPEIFYTVEQPQLAGAVVNIMSRLLGDYLLQLHDGADEQACAKLELKIKSLMRKARRLQVNRFDEQAWLELVLLDCYQPKIDKAGRQEDACLHMAAELSAMYEVSYGAVLGVLLPAWIRFVCAQDVTRYRAFAKNVMEVADNLEPQEQLKEAVLRLEQFFLGLGLRNNLCELGIEAFCLKNVAQICTGYGWKQEQSFGIIKQLYWEDLYQIYQSVYNKVEERSSCSA